MNDLGIAFFDLDHTLVDGDSDTSFLDWLGDRGELEGDLLERKNVVHDRYLAGEPWQPLYRVLLDEIFAGRDVSAMEELAARHATECVFPMLFSGARELIESERAQRSEVCLLTATNQLVTRPVADALGMDTLLSTRLEVRDGRFTGRLEGDFCAGPGKAEALRVHCEQRGVDPKQCSMYGDGRSDMEALDLVGEPVAVHPTDALRKQAEQRAWRIVDLS